MRIGLEALIQTEYLRDRINLLINEILIPLLYLQAIAEILLDSEPREGRWLLEQVLMRVPG